MTNTPTQLYDEVMKLAEAGDEAAVEKFLSDHLAEFPEETRNQLVGIYLKDAIVREGEEVRARADAESAMLNVVDDTKKVRRHIENQKRIGELKQQLGTE